MPSGGAGEKHHLDELLAVSLLLLLLHPGLKVLVHPRLAMECRHIRRRDVCESLAPQHGHGVDGRLGARDGEGQVRKCGRNLLEGAPDNGTEAPAPKTITGTVTIHSHPRRGWCKGAACKENPLPLEFFC